MILARKSKRTTTNTNLKTPHTSATFSSLRPATALSCRQKQPRHLAIGAHDGGGGSNSEESAVYQAKKTKSAAPRASLPTASLWFSARRFCHYDFLFGFSLSITDPIRRSETNTIFGCCKRQDKENPCTQTIGDAKMLRPSAIPSVAVSSKAAFLVSGIVHLRRRRPGERTVGHNSYSSNSH